MLYAHDTGRRDDRAPGDADMSWLRDTARWMFSALARRRMMVAGIALIFALAAVAYVLLRSPSYTAATQIHITNLRLTNSRDDSFYAEVQMEPRFIDTQLQILRSEHIGYAVVDNLDLTQRLKNNSQAWLSRWFKSVAPPTEKSADAERRAALRFVQLGMLVQQVGLSEVVEIRFTSDDRDLSAAIANALYQAYLADQEKARGVAAQTGSSWLRERLREVGPRSRALTIATPPKDANGPRGLLILALAIGAGLSVGAAVALAREAMDKTVRTPEQLEGGVAGEFLGIFPRATTSTHARRAQALKETAVRQILAVWMRRPQRTSRTLGVVSTFRHEGSSHVAREIARSLALANLRVLLVDADAMGSRNPESGTDAPAELLEWSDATADDTIDRIVPGDVDGLSVLPVGSDDTGDLVRWGRQGEELLESLLSRFDFIVVDLPPLATSAGARGALVLDDYLLVVKWGAVQHEHVRVALTKLAAVRHKLIGFVLNEVNLAEARKLPSTELNFLLQNDRVA